MLRQMGVDMVAPAAVARYLDTPGITPAIAGVLEDASRPVIVDLGGDVQGARVLGQYRAILRERGYCMYLVVNPFRPTTQDSAGIGAAIADIEGTTHLFVAGLVGNPNLLAETTLEHVLEGWRVVERASHQLHMPLAFLAVEAHLLPEARRILPAELPLLALERFFMPVWGDAGEG